MFSHLMPGINDVERALAFYQPLMQAPGCRLRFIESERPWAGWENPDSPRPLFLIGCPYDGNAAHAGNGNRVAFLASSRAQVQAVHARSLQLGAHDEGTPGLRPEYHAPYFGACFRTPEGNKLVVVCHQQE